MSSSVAAVEHLTIQANGLSFYCAAAGPVDGPLVLLLHGFPEFSYGWRNQIGPLAAAGLRVVVPDQRGYGLSDKPSGVAAYDIDVLARDVVALADAFGAQTFSVVGHDWGGIVAWRVASDFGDRLDRLVILNAPNLDVVGAHAARHPTQLLKSFYVALFQMPYVPEWSMAASDYALLAGALRNTSRPGTFPDDALMVYRQAWSQPGALTSMLAWYRALPWRRTRTAKRIATPTLVVWGDRDTALDASLAEDSAALCDDVRIHHIATATHWVHHEEPTPVDALLRAFLVHA